jgi:hypothetical protein
MNYPEISELVGKTLSKIEVSEDKRQMVFVVDDGTSYKFYHEQDCCEDVQIEDVVGELDDLIGSPLLMAEEATNSNETPEGEKPHEAEYADDSYTWTFYKFATIKGYVTIRWYGSSNGYYGEGVDFIKVN